MPKFAAVNNSTTDVSVRATSVPTAPLYSIPKGGATINFTCDDMEFDEVKAQLDGLVTSLTPNFTYTVPGQPDDAIGKRTLTVGHAQLTNAVNGTAMTFAIGAELPANARILGVELTGVTQFTGGGVASVSLKVGGTDDDCLVAAEDVLGGGTLNRRGTVGVDPQGALGGQQLNAIFTPDGGHNLDQLTAGAITITVLYAVVQ